MCVCVPAENACSSSPRAIGPPFFFHPPDDHLVAIPVYLCELSVHKKLSSPVNLEKLVAARLLPIPPLQRILEVALPQRLPPRVSDPPRTKAHHELRRQKVQVVGDVFFPLHIAVGWPMLAAVRPSLMVQLVEGVRGRNMKNFLRFRR